MTKLAAESKNPVIKEFAEKVLQSFKGQEDAAGVDATGGDAIGGDSTTGDNN